MLHIRAIKLEVNTADGLFGTVLTFNKGLNIIRANNTTGKSTIFQSILYALGFEELLGAKYEKTMQSVLKDEVIDMEDIKHKVLQSYVILEIENKEIVTIRRSVVSAKRKSTLIDVFKGPYITSPEGSYEVSQMFVHERGAASDEIFGFHAFLENYLGWDLPEVLTTSGDFVKLYMTLIAPSFIVEQKKGWSDFFATQPFYNIRNADARVVEFLLNMDVFQNERRKQIINQDKRVIQEKWQFVYNEFRKFAERVSGELIGLNESPVIINKSSDIYIRVIKQERSYLIPELVSTLSAEYNTLLNSNQDNTSIDLQKSANRLDELSSLLNKHNFRYEQISSDTFHEKEKIKQFILQRKNVEEDLKNNKTAQRMYTMGADLPTSIAKRACPTCGNELKDSLLPKEADQTPMLIDENILFLEAQRKMIEVFIEGQRKLVIESETRMSDYKNQIGLLRSQIRAIKRDLVSDDRLPSEAEIENKINLRRQIEFYDSAIEKIDDFKDQVMDLSKKWTKVLKSEKALPKDFFSAEDRVKLGALEKNLIFLLNRFNYHSKESDAIKISSDKYQPSIEIDLGNGRTKSYDIRFDSSGSDLIRCLWAYYVSLFKTSREFNGCHPDLLVFDEPQQQSASTTDFHDFLNELSGYPDSQIIVFGSFQNSEEDFIKATEGIYFNLIKSEARFIKKMD